MGIAALAEGSPRRIQGTARVHLAVRAVGLREAGAPSGDEGDRVE